MGGSIKRILVTGGAGFIGSAFIRFALDRCAKIVNLDLLTYAADLSSLASVADDPRYLFVQGDIRDTVLVETLCRDHAIDTIVHFAAESHVDRSIASPLDFFHTNVFGTLQLLEVVRKFPHIHFHHVSTDEVYGSLPEVGQFSENSPYKPNSPYAASKAASDHFVRAYAHTYDLSVTISHCSNNYGPFQNHEKLIPKMILNCVQRKPLPIYGQGINVRDWLYVDDHADALWKILEKGKKNEVYAIGGNCEKRNIDILHILIEEIALQQKEDPALYHSLVRFVPDRLGHDLRYAIDATKIRNDLNWTPRTSFNEGIKQTIAWYLNK